MEVLFGGMMGRPVEIEQDYGDMMRRRKGQYIVLWDEKSGMYLGQTEYGEELAAQLNFELMHGGD